ncbi:hypothetical protein [Deinococcus ficus]|uniref:hypothetical protein n=1 Tax=Deinococcus ficus TaxID=317577 RepID=UPI0012DCE11E|nr:hypothetical protein [Deinococcus ficus]
MRASSSPRLLSTPPTPPLDQARRLALVRLRIKARDARGPTRPLRVAMIVEARRGLLIRADAGLLLPHLDRPARVTVFVPWEEAATAGEFRAVPTQALSESGVTAACAPVVGEVTGPVRGAFVLTLDADQVRHPGGSLVAK